MYSWLNQASRELDTTEACHANMLPPGKRHCGKSYYHAGNIRLESRYILPLVDTC